jgi:hypothetical protein
MAFYKKDNEQLTIADFVTGRDYVLSEAGKDEHSYPIDGWYWFADLDAALTGLANAPAPTTAATKRQICRALLQMGLLDIVEAEVATMSREAQVDWATATEIERTHTFVLEMQVKQNLTDQQMDDLFTLAKTF